MTFPTVAGTSSNTTSATTSHSVSLPASIAAGDLLIIFIGVQDDVQITAPNLTTPSGWTQLFHDQNANIGTAKTFAGYYKIADGGEGASVSVTADQTSSGGNNSYRITGYTGTPEDASNAQGTSTTPNPPNLAPSWGADDNLWIAACLEVNASNDLAAPTNYTNVLQNAIGGAANQVGSARRELNASSEDPGTFSNASNAAWIAATVAVRGVSVTTAPKMKYYKQRRAA